MIHPLRLVFGLLACLALASGLPALFPRDKITTYRYYGVVQSETLNPTLFASQFLISGLMHVTPEISDPNLKNAFYVSLDVTYGVRNGEIDVSERITEDKLQPIPDAAKALKDPFVAVFNDNGKVKALIINENEAGWSRNMKKSIASTLQLDLASMHLQMPMEPQKFSSNESTVYGDCVVDYNIKSEPERGEKMFIVTKFMEPMKCTKFNQHTFNSEESEDCFTEEKDKLGASSRRTFLIENNGEDLLIKKLEAHGLIHYSPWKDQSETHYVLVNQIIDFESSVPVGSITLPTLNMRETVTLNDVTFQKPQSKYADKAGVDLSYGRHVVDAEVSITELIEMLGEAADYMNENHWEMTAPEMKHGQTMNRILDMMSFMDTQSLGKVFDRISEGGSEKEATIRKMFLQMLPYVGTDATSLYIVNIIHNHTISDMVAIAMLTKLPFYVRAPTGELLVEMESLMNFGDDVSWRVRKAGILAFATLIHKAHKYEKYHHTLDPELVSKYVNQYFGHVMNETSYQTKMLYIQAMNNIGTADVFELLEPIVSGRVVLSEKPQYLRLMAMYAFERASHANKDIDDLFWPILESDAAPLEIRAAALTILFKQPPKAERFMKLLVSMEHESNEHLYNYYYTTLESFANSSSSCMKPLKEMASNVLLDSRVRRPASADLLTTVAHMDYENEEFGFGESWMGSLVADEHTGNPFFCTVEYSTTDGGNLVNDMTFFLRVEGIDDVIGPLPWGTSLADLNAPVQMIVDLLKKASEDMPGKKPIHVEFAVMRQGRVVISEYFDKESLPESMGAFMNSLFASIVQDMSSWESVMFDKLYTKQVSNDLGLPTIFETKIPRVISVHQNITHIPHGWNIEMGAKYWSHGYQSMEVYNPIIDAWHAVRRVSAVDSSLPFAMSIKFPGINEFTVTLPRLPMTKYSVSYTRVFHENYVMVIGAQKDVLELSCPNCNLIEMASSSEEDNQNRTLLSFDSGETGLTISQQQYGCARGPTPMNESTIFSKSFDNIDDMQLEDLAALGLMALREHQLHTFFDLEIGGCGYLTKIEPSQAYPTSEIDINVYMNQSPQLPKKLSLPPAININFNASIVVKAESKKDLVQSLTVNGHWNSTEGYLQNDLQLDVTLSGSEEKEDLKLCIDAHKTYPPLVSDPFDRTVNPDIKTTGQLSILFGETTTEACPSEGLSLRIEMEGKMSDAQKDALEHGKIHDACQRDVENPLYMYAESSIVPRTPACLREALLRTTLRQYVFHVFYQNIPERVTEPISWAADTFHSVASNGSTNVTVHAEAAQATIFVEFPLISNGLNLNMRGLGYESNYTDFLSDDDGSWNDLMDNTYFSSEVLDSIHDKDDKFCAIYPEILMNADGASIPYTVPNQWTLVTGDYTNHLFSVFVKRIEPKKLGLLITVTNHTIEVTPRDTNPIVIVDGNVTPYENGLTVPENEDEDDDSLAYRITWSTNPKRFQIESTFSAFDLEWTERSVSLVMSSILQGKVAGLCGQLDGTQKERIARVYSLNE